MQKLFVGIDISKESSNAHGLDENGESRFSMVFSMNEEGFAKLYKALKSNCDDLSEAMVAMESTACYHINLFSFLTSKGINAIVINPLLIANFAKLSLRKTKTDKKDALTIARFILANKDSVSQIAISQDLQDLRDLARERESLTDQMSESKTEIKRLLQTLFPELETICATDTAVMLDFLQEFPSARAIKAAKRNAIEKALKRKKPGPKLTYTADDLIKAAHSSIASVSPAKEFILKGKISTLLHLKCRRDELTKALTEYCKSAILEDLNIITSIKGIDKGTATTFLAELGNIDNFSSHKKLIAFAGIEPTVYQSGKFEGKSRISKRGNRHMRRVLWIMTTCAIQHNDTFRAYYLKKREAGQCYKKAVCATAHKLMRVIFALLSQKVYFSAECR